MLVTALFLAAYVASLIWLPKPTGRIVLGDAVHYYVYLRSAVFDRDLQFANEYERIYGPGVRTNPDAWWIYEKTATGHTRNQMSIGPAIVCAPLYVLTAAAVAAADALGSRYPHDGYGRLFQASTGISGILAAAAGVWLAFLWARRLFDTRIAIWATLAAWLGSSALYYSVVSPTYSHAASMFTAGLFFYTWGSTLDRQTAGRYALVGLLGGVTALVRWQDAIFLVAPVLDLVWHVGRSGNTHGKRVVRTSGLFIACCSGALVGFLPQLLVWTILYGSPLLVPQGQSFMRWTAPDLFAVLFSVHGLFSWTPVIALAVVGCAWLFRVNRLIAIATVAVLLLEWYVNAAVADWWAGEAFGARRFVSCLPLFVLGLGALFNRIGHGHRAMAATATVAICLNLLLLIQYQVFLKGLRDIAPYPEGFYGLFVARFVVPLRIAARLWHLLL